jgi:ligand-binding SRPBCC domain-containing protein
MAIYQLQTIQKLPIPLDEAWQFLSSPRNLEKITPKEMSFSIISEFLADSMYPGMFINYSVKPLWGIKMNWLTEITHVEDRKYFVDEQRSGPYAIWHHEHRLEEIEGGVLMTDLLSYKLPFGFLGDILHWLFLKKKINSIFQYREQSLITYFGPFKK